MCFHVLMCVSLSYEFLLGVIMMFIGIMLSLMKFGGQTSKTFESYPLRRSCMSLVCLECYDVFYVFVLG